jgi:hypothetical protein
MKWLKVVYKDWGIWAALAAAIVGLAAVYFFGPDALNWVN